MTKRQLTLIALVLCLAFALSGCNLIRTDPAYIAQQQAEEEARIQAEYEKDLAQVIATFDGGTLTKGEIVDAFNEQASMYSEFVSYSNYMYMMMYGTSSQETVTVEQLESLRQRIAENYVRRKIMEQKISENGLGEITPEDLEKVKADAQTEFSEYLEVYKAMGADEATARMYLGLDGVSESGVYEAVYNDLLKARLDPFVNKDTVLSEEEIRAFFDELVENDRKAGESNPQDVEDYVQQGKTIFYMPEGCRFIKHVFLKPDEEVLAAMMEAQNSVTALEDEIAAIEQKIADGEDAAGELEAKKAELESANNALKDAQDAVWANVNDDLEKVKAAMDAGEDFDAIIAEYSDDNEHGLENVTKNGYLVYRESTKWDKAFLEQANALENVGDFSEPFLGSMGVHVLLYANECAPGAIDLESVKDEVSELALTRKKTETLTAAADEWYAAANVQYSFENWKLR